LSRRRRNPQYSSSVYAKYLLQLSGHQWMYFDVIPIIKRNFLTISNPVAVSKYPLHFWSNNSCQRKYPFNPIPVPDEPLIKGSDPTKIPVGNCAEAMAGSKILKA